MMKNAALITLLISGMAFAAVAQEHGWRQPKSAEEIAQMRTDRLTEKLGLTESQQKDVYALNLERAEKMKASYAERSAKLTEMRKVRQAEMAERRAEMKATQERLNEILNDEQRDVLKQQQAEHADKVKSKSEARKKGKVKGERFNRGKKDFHKRTNRSRTTTISPEAN